MIPDLIRLLDSQFLCYIPLEYLLTLAATNLTICNLLCKRWSKKWIMSSMESINYIYEIKKNKSKKHLGYKMYHLYLENVHDEWWFNNHMVYLFHLYARKHASIAKDYNICKERHASLIQLNQKFKKINNLKCGQIYDILDRNNIWSGAVIISITEFVIKFRCFGWTNKYNECIFISEVKKRVAPFGMNSLQWFDSKHCKLKPKQYCLICRSDILCSLRTDISLDRSDIQNKVTSGYIPVEIQSVYRSDDNKYIVQINARLEITQEYCTCDSGDCKKHPFGSDSRPKPFLIKVKYTDLLPLNDITALIFLSKNILYAPFLAADVSTPFQNIIRFAKQYTQRKINQHSQKVCEYCNENHMYRVELEKMGTKMLPWTTKYSVSI
tara:strand:- start:3901 stop:5046 length:1146 start_codon:yes stop_codon:yes gene_type:complete